MSADDDFDPRRLGAHIAEAEWHFHRQLLKRCGIILGVGQFSKIVMDIRSNRAALIEASSGSRGLYMVHVKGAGRVYVLAVNGQPRTAWPVRNAKRLLKWAKELGVA